jgi:diketogulonate reductase-like aldo/keto reductase
VLGGIRKKYWASVANVAVRAILDRLAVTGIIVGCWLSVSQHIVDNQRMFEIALDDEDRSRSDAVMRNAQDRLRTFSG